MMAIATLGVTSFLLGIRHLGGLQSLELMVFDSMVRSKSNLDSDPRLLVVSITEEDGKIFNRLPLSDEIIAQALEKLLQLQARVIGIDLYREIPYEPGTQKLTAVLKSPKIITIKNLGDDISSGIQAPPGVPPERIGINDILLDPDGTVRRNLMFATTKEGTFFSFSLRLAMKYLEAQNITPKNSQKNKDLIEWGKAEFMPLKTNSGGYETIDDRGYQILLNYRSSESGTRQISVAQLLYGEVDPSWVKDKIILIGTTASSIRDLFLTPYSPAKEASPKMSGVLIHAQMVSQIVDAVEGNRPLFQFWPEWAEMLWIGSWALIGSSLALFSRYPLEFVFGCPILLGIVGGIGFALFIDYHWVPITTPALAFISTGVIMAAYRAHQSQQQQQTVMRLLGQNTSPEVAEFLWKSRDRLIEDGKLPGQKLMATMLFTDIKDFSTISEIMPPEKLMEWLNEYLGILTESVQTNRGIINKFTGDGIMAAFGVPIPRTTPEEIAADARSAVTAGLMMGDRLDELNQHWKQRGLPTIEMRVGIFTGPIVAGSLGGKERSEYGLLGDSVNIASRLESCQKERQSTTCRVLIAYQTLSYIRGEFLVEHWGPLALKGKQQTVDVYRVISKKI
ncbi:adenylate cyclase [Oscillatoriales cyanobacterium USR001]|nr:adenylate cyclase [Oscillatoriales cyanobacterium USR001]